MSQIKIIRERLGVSQRVLASGIGVTQSNISHYERWGQTVPPQVARRLIEFARQRGVSLSFDDVYAESTPEAPKRQRQTGKPAHA